MGHVRKKKTGFLEQEKIGMAESPAQNTKGGSRSQELVMPDLKICGSYVHLSHFQCSFDTRRQLIARLFFILFLR